MKGESAGYIYLGIPAQLADVLASTVQDFRRSLSTHGESPWAQLTSATLSRGVLHFACMYREHQDDFPDPAVACSEVFHLLAEELMTDTTAARWGVPAHMVCVVAATVAICGQLVVDRMGPDISNDA